MAKLKKIVITGGHLTPALAVIDELKKRGGWKILFLGRDFAMEGDKTPAIESQIIPSLGIRFLAIKAGRVQRRFTRWTILSLLKIPLGFFQSFYYLCQFKPDIILSFGGYVSVPTVLAAWILRIPIVTHEQTTVQGLANKVNAFFSQKVAVSWPQAVVRIPAEKVVLTGNPVRKEIFRVKKRKKLKWVFAKKLPLVFITGGNQGSWIINQVVAQILPKLVREMNVFHQTGYLEVKGDFEKLQRLKKRLPKRFHPRYHLAKYLLSEDMAMMLLKADLIVSRAGANTLSELMALGKPALLIPLPWLYQDEQTKNALMLAGLGAAEVLTQDELCPETLFSLIKKMLKNLSHYQKNALKTKNLIKKDAAKRLVDLVEEISR